VKELAGVAASAGSGVAPAWVQQNQELDIPAGKIDDAGAEVAALHAAIDDVTQELNDKSANAEGELAEVLDAQAMMAADPELLEGAESSIKEQSAPAARAIIDAGEKYASVLEASESEYMAARAEDIRDVCMRIARRVLGAPPSAVEAISEPVVIAAAELPPADVAGLDPKLIAGIATEQGSGTSHTAIVARSLGIPAAVGVRGLLAALGDASLLAVDGDAGVVYVDPDDDVRHELSSREEARRQRRGELAARVGDRATHTTDGQRIEIAANVGAAAELGAALEEGAEGVGLLRTELLYLERTEPPDEDEQLKLLTGFIEQLGDRRLVVRTFDFGADKPVPFLEQDPEENPALGVRGIRTAREHPELLDTQLRAVVRAAEAGGRLAVMAPMVATAEEAEWFVERAEAAGAREAGVELGAMVEVPAAVLVAGALAERLDFFSIGTNDLTQYLHAADRQQGALAYLQDPFSPALLAAVQKVCEAEGTWVGVCGEAAGDPAWAVVAVGLGVAELSMGAQSILEVKAAITALSLEECRAVAAAALRAPDAAAARRVATEALP